MKTVFFIILLSLFCFSEKIEVEKEDFQELIKLSKEYSYNSMLYADLLYPFNLHFYKITTEKLELESGTLLKFNLSLFQKPTSYNENRSIKVYGLDFEYEDNYKGVDEKYDKKEERIKKIVNFFKILGVGLGAFSTGIIVGAVAF